MCYKDKGNKAGSETTTQAQVCYRIGESSMDNGAGVDGTIQTSCRGRELSSNCCKLAFVLITTDQSDEMLENC